MTGTIKVNNETYIFRNDHAHGDEFWAWNIKDDYTSAMTHKWNKLPKNSEVTLFDVDNPPRTVPFQPTLN